MLMNPDAENRFKTPLKYNKNGPLYSLSCVPPSRVVISVQRSSLEFVPDSQLAGGCIHQDDFLRSSPTPSARWPCGIIANRSLRSVILFRIFGSIVSRGIPPQSWHLDVLRNGRYG